MADTRTAIQFLPEDLAPGDTNAARLDCRELDLVRVTASDAPLFAMAYDRLIGEFGPREMETRDVITRRLGWFPSVQLGGAWLRYELILVRWQGHFVAVRDHTAVVRTGGVSARAVVHLSHVLVEPSWRRTGLAGWLRAWPIQAARAGLEAAEVSGPSAITLVAEMEHPDPQFPNRLIRLQAYEKAGFRKVDPARVPYVQPDFRTPEEIDASGGPRPLPFGLVIRRLGQEQEQTLRGAEVRALVEDLYAMYGATFRETDMAVLRSSLQRYPEAEARIALLPPTVSSGA
jgi:GNAT superfamily N-acetyltransferase